MHGCTIALLAAGWGLQGARAVGEVSDGFDEPGFFVVELLVVGAVFEEFGQEFEEALFVHDEEFLDVVGFVGVGGEDLRVHC